MLQTNSGLKRLAEEEEGAILLIDLRENPGLCQFIWMYLIIILNKAMILM